MSTPSMPQDADEAAKRVKELSDRMIELTKKNGLSWLEAYEKVLNGMLQLEERAAAATQIEWINALATTNADFTREMSAAYFKTARDQLK
jgi:citrate synthase